MFTTKPSRFRMMTGLATFPLLLVIAVGYAAPDSVSAEQSTVKIGFEREADVFECLPGDRVALEDSNDGKALRWDIKYVKQQHRVCAKKLEKGAVAGMTEMSFKVRSDSPHHLWIQLNEADGEGFYKIITPGDKWKTITIKLAELKLNDDKVVNRRLDVDQIARILVIDASALSDAAGEKRTVWFSDWKFTGPEDAGEREQSAARTPRGDSVTAQELDDPKLLEAKVRSVLPTREEENWMRIPWQGNLMQARVDSQSRGMPMLIWVMDGNVLGCT